jgi:hypothetical protein
MSSQAERYFGSVSSPYWTSPAIWSPTRIVKRVVSGSSVIGKPSDGSSQNSTTSGVRWSASSASASASTVGVSRTFSPTNSVTPT